MLALITRLTPGFSSVPVIQMVWLSCQVTFERRPLEPGILLITSMSVQVAPPLVVTSMKPEPAPTTMRFRSVGLMPMLNGEERNRRAVGTLLVGASALAIHFQPQAGLFTTAQV